MKSPTPPFLPILLLSLLTGIANAQPGFNLQLHLQPQSTGISGDFHIPDGSDPGNTDNFTTLEKSFTLGFAAGLSAAYNFTDNSALSLGLSFSKQGQEFKNLFQAGTRITPTGTSNYRFTDSYSSSINYLKIPFLFHYYSTAKSSVTFSAHAGLYLAVPISYQINKYSSWNETVYHTSGSATYINGAAEYKATDNSIHYSGYYSTDNGGGINFTYNDIAPFISKPYNSSDLGAMIGAGIQIKLSEKLFLPIHLIYDFGFSDIKNHGARYDDSQVGSTPEFFWGDDDNPNRYNKLTNATLGLQAGLRINFSKPEKKEQPSE